MGWAAALMSLGLAPAVRAQTGTPAPRRPNVVFILCDDLRKGALGSEGHPFAKTPHIDRIGREGMTFTNTFITTPVCSPSRASFLTGQYAHTHGVRKNTRYEELSHQLVTFPRLLHDAGYETAYVGKWHMGQDDTPRPGFDRWVSFKGQGEYYDPQLNVDGKQTRAKGYATDVLTDYAAEFVRRPHPKPFLLYLAHKAPHGPFRTAERHKTLYAGRPISRAPSAAAVPDVKNKPALKRYTDKPITDENIRNQLRMLTAVDEGVGRLFQALEETGQLDNTVLVFSSDHGYFWGEHGLTEKRLAYDEALKVPFLVRYPKSVAPGAKNERFVQSIDLAPTLLELGGAPIPAHIQGRSLVPLLKGQAPPDWRTSVLAEFEPTTQEPFPAWQAVRTAHWKYIHYLGAGEGLDELYDLEADPHELKNLAGEPGARAARKKMSEELSKLLLAYGGHKPGTAAPAASKR
jgi:N-acetylglucosamine-6-sulfatase